VLRGFQRDIGILEVDPIRNSVLKIFPYNAIMITEKVSHDEF